MTPETEQLRFKEARDGDHLMVPFQCDTCHFRNIMKRSPTDHIENDCTILQYIRRANLDAFWSRESSTVAHNLREARRMETRVADRLGIPSISRPMGPFPLDDVYGMAGAIAILDRSLDKGKYATHVQYETFRKTRSTITNIHQASVAGLGDSVMAYERSKMWMSSVPSHQFWFTRFMEGVHRRVGQIRKPARPFTIEEIHELDKVLEEQWMQADDVTEQKRLCEVALLTIIPFCTGLRGEEVLQIDTHRTRQGLQHLKRDSQPHFRLTIIGRTKGVRQDGAKFEVPCVAVTEGTSLHPAKWVERLVRVLTKIGKHHGRLVERHLRPGKLVEFANDVFLAIERVQLRGFIADDIDVRDQYGLDRSARRGSTAHARNMQVPLDIINANNRWRVEANSTTGNPRLDMVDVYSALDALLPTVLEYSRRL
mmetsp:Transcript_17572/g.49643  ORF Transcript_17572/g.49643 Transcript_17572/m.49643 type:complete len:426 (+) Transcript_17572:14374-15651(+)